MPTTSNRQRIKLLVPLTKTNLGHHTHRIVPMDSSVQIWFLKCQNWKDTNMQVRTSDSHLVCAEITLPVGGFHWFVWMMTLKLRTCDRAGEFSFVDCTARKLDLFLSSLLFLLTRHCSVYGWLSWMRYLHVNINAEGDGRGQWFKWEPWSPLSGLSLSPLENSH